jgi:hypothetical protein
MMPCFAYIVMKEKNMARSDTRYSVYPAPKAVEVVGETAPALNQAIECWAALLIRSMADNSNRTFPLVPNGVSIGHITGKLQDCHHLHHWALLANVLKDMRFDPDFAKPSELLATAVEDAHRLENVAEKYFASEFDMEEYARGLETSVTELVAKLRMLDYPAAWAIIVTVQWLWEHQDEGIDVKTDEWWSLAFRRKWLRRATTKQPSRKGKKT